jgi:hypothetical protein
MKKFLIFCLLLVCTTAGAVTVPPWWMIGQSADENGVASFGEDIYCDKDVSALSFTDRSDSPATLADAYEIVESLKSTPDGKVDHTALSPKAWGTSEVQTGAMVGKTALAPMPVGAPKGEKPKAGESVTTLVPETTKVPDQSKRNLSMVVSAQALVIKDLLKRIEALEAK